jgi:hypothetical protein
MDYLSCVTLTRLGSHGEKHMGLRVVLNEPNPAEQPARNVVLKFLDKLAEAALRRELRVIERGQPFEGQPATQAAADGPAVAS